MIKKEQVVLLHLRGGPFGWEDLKSVLDFEFDEEGCEKAQNRDWKMKNTTNTLYKMLDTAFDWGGTTEGRRFWEKIYEELKIIEQRLNFIW